MHIPLLYHQKPIFGLDISQSSIKVAQLRAAGANVQALGYGYTQFDRTAVQKGVIMKPEVLKNAFNKLVDSSIVGKISTNRIVASIPTAFAYTRIMELPSLKNDELEEAVRLEVEQYVPVPVSELYIEHRIIQAPKKPEAITPEKKRKKEKFELKNILAHHKDKITVDPNQVVLMVAVPKKIVDSFISFFDSISLDAMAIEPAMFANFRTVNFLLPSNAPRIIIDFGAHSSDIAIYDGVVKLVNTVDTGGWHITQQIMKSLNLDEEQANKVKTHFGIAKSKWQVKLANSLQPILSDFANEVQKTMHYYYEHRDGSQNIHDIVMVGGGANMPGLADFLTHLTGVEVRSCDPWKGLQLAALQPPYQSETTLYDTAIGLALKEIIPT